MKRLTVGRLVARALIALEGVLFPPRHHPLTEWLTDEGQCERCGARLFASRPCAVCGDRRGQEGATVVSLRRRRRRAA